MSAPASPAASPEILLCAPEFFTVKYEINPWMDLNDPVDPALAWKQWQHFHDTLVDLGVTIHLLPPIEGLPDIVFTGDGGLVFQDRFIRSNFLHKERQPEALHFQKWFQDHGFKIELLPEDVIFEGLGDIVICGRTGIAAYGQRTSRTALDHVRARLPEINWIAELELVSPLYFHIGVALSLLDDKTGLYVPEAFSEASRHDIEALDDYDMIPLSDDDARGFAVNAVVVDRNLVMHHCSDPLKQELESRGFKVIICDVGEFVKSGGGTRCLVLPFAT